MDLTRKRPAGGKVIALVSGRGAGSSPIMARVSCLQDGGLTELDVMREALEHLDRRVTSIMLASLSVETLHHSTEASALTDLVGALQGEIREALQECHQ
jgi:hypothetical protein